MVGASRNPEAQGYRYIRHLLDFGFRGPIYPINPQYSDVLGLPCYPDVLNLPQAVDYVISCIPAASAAMLIPFTARFSETGHQPAAALERELLKKARQRQIRLLGPNCIGLYEPEAGLSMPSIA